MDPCDIFAIFRRMDKDKDGCISYIEFVEGIVPSKAKNDQIFKISSPRASQLGSPRTAMA